jgi:outer membrane protein OmpA-like peptidoglycan-associated protein
MPFPRRQPSGQGKIFLIIGLAAFAVSAALFLGYAWPKWFPKLAEAPMVATAPAPPSTAPESGDTKPTPEIPTPPQNTDQPVGSNPEPVPTPPPIPAVVGPIQPPVVMEKLATAFLAEDPAAVQSALGRRVVPENVAAGLANLFSTHNLDTANAVAQLGSQPALQRWAIYLKADHPVGSQVDARVAVELDFVRDSRGQWWPGAITLPQDAKEAAPPAPEADPEAIAAARSAANALVSGAMTDLITLVDLERFSPAQATGLAAMLQEGAFSLKPDAAPVVTLAAPAQVWLMMPIVSSQWQTESQFGIILRKKTEGDPWLVAVFNPDSLLAVTANRLAAGDAATSLIRNPGQPDALCLYFSPKSAETDDRSRRLVALAAAMLNAEPTLRIRLLGHTDATENDGFEKKLSLARVESAAKLLLDAGIPAEIIERETHGSQRPRRANFLPDGKPDPRALLLNRRVEMIFTK